MKKLILFFSIGIFLLAGCTKVEPTSEISEPANQPAAGQNEEEGYPVWEPRDLPEAGYPVEEVTPEFPQGPDFSIDLPVEAGDTIVTGTGPADVPIILVNVSEVGTLLGETVITKDGTFAFELENPLESGNSIGIQLGDLEGTDFDPNDFVYSETYYSRPLVGILFDMAFIQ